MHRHTAVAGADLLCMHAEVKLDSLALQLLADRVAGIAALTRQQAVALDDRDLRAEAAERLRELHADRTAAEYDDALRDFLEAGARAGGPVLDVLQPVDGRDDWIRSGRDHDALGLDLLVADDDPAWPLDPC